MSVSRRAGSIEAVVPIRVDPDRITPNARQPTMKDLRSFPLGLVILLAAIVLAGAHRYQRARAQRPARLEAAGWLAAERSEAPGGCELGHRFALPQPPGEEPRRLPQVAASPLGMPIDLSALQGRPAARPRNRFREADGINVREERAALYQLEAEVERLASPPGRFPRQAFDDLDGAPAPAPPRPIWSLSADLPDPVIDRLGFQGEFFAGETRGTHPEGGF
ncbi:MAG: hypothetical protein ABIK89_02025 [Planctomycetota bacterium]